MPARVIKADNVGGVFAAARRFGLDPSTADAGAVRAAFRRTVRTSHPDRGGTAAAFRQAVADRDLLLSHVAGRGWTTLPAHSVGRHVDVYA